MTDTRSRPDTGVQGRAAASDRYRTDASEKRRRRTGKIFLYAAMSVFAVIFLFPLVFMFVSSLKPDAQILQDIDSPMAFLPVGDISLDNYFGVFDRVPVAQFLFNSVLVTVLPPVAAEEQPVNG